MPALAIRGMDQLVAKLGRAKAMQTYEPPMQRAVLRVQRPMQEYPPPPPHSTYRRTGTYGRRWITRVESSSAGLTGRVGNNVYYGPFVGSSIFQTATHRATGWTTDAEALKQNEAAILADFAQVADKALAS
jgi:hypothetical protein